MGYSSKGLAEDDVGMEYVGSSLYLLPPCRQYYSKGFKSIGPLLLTWCFELGSVIFISVEENEVQSQRFVHLCPTVSYVDLSPSRFIQSPSLLLVHRLL